MAKCTYVKRSGNICDRKCSGVRCEAHHRKRNKLRRKTKKTKDRKTAHTATAIRFYDVAEGRMVSVPREHCKIRRSQGRGGDQVYTTLNGRRLYTFVARGFEL